MRAEFLSKTLAKQAQKWAENRAEGDMKTLRGKESTRK